MINFNTLITTYMCFKGWCLVRTFHVAENSILPFENLCIMPLTKFV